MASLLSQPSSSGAVGPQPTAAPTKKFYKTRAGIGGKLKDADPLVVWYLGLAFSIPAILMVLLPLFECTVSTCDEEDGNISISSVIENLPLATVYAVLGAITLTILCYYQLIICKRGWKIIFAIYGYLCLLVPLMLPLTSGIDNAYHDVFAVMGFLSQIIFIILVFLDLTYAAPMPPNGTGIVYICAFAVIFAIVMFIAGIIVGDEDYGYNLVYEIIAEYLIGLAALTLVKTLEVSFSPFLIAFFLVSPLSSDKHCSFSFPNNSTSTSIPCPGSATSVAGPTPHCPRRGWRSPPCTTTTHLRAAVCTQTTFIHSFMTTLLWSETRVSSSNAAIRELICDVSIVVRDVSVVKVYAHQ